MLNRLFYLDEKHVFIQRIKKSPYFDNLNNFIQDLELYDHYHDENEHKALSPMQKKHVENMEKDLKILSCSSPRGLGYEIVIVENKKKKGFFDVTYTVGKDNKKSFSFMPFEKDGYIFLENKEELDKFDECCKNHENFVEILQLKRAFIPEPAEHKPALKS